MQLIAYLIELTAFFPLAVWCKELLFLGSGMLLAPRFGFKLNQFSLFGHQFLKQNGIWTHRRDKRSIHIQSMLRVDLTQPRPADVLERQEKQLEALRVLLLCIVTALLTVPSIPSILRIWHGGTDLLDAFLAGLSVGMCFQSLTTIGIRLYVYGVMMKKLGGYVQSLTNRLRAGAHFSDLGLRPVEELPYRNPTGIEKRLYYGLYLSAMLESGQIGALQKPTRELTAMLRDSDVLIADTWCYYWLVFYYSRFELNPAAATHFLNKIRTTIEHDRDANAKRVLAYYAFGIEQNFPKSRAFLDEAYAVIDQFSTLGERDLERRLLDELDKFLRQKGV